MKDYEVVIGLEVHVELATSVDAQLSSAERLTHILALCVQVCRVLFLFLIRRL